MPLATGITGQSNVGGWAGTLLYPTHEVDGIRIFGRVLQRYVVDDARALVGIRHSDFDFIQMVEQALKIEAI